MISCFCLLTFLSVSAVFAQHSRLVNYTYIGEFTTDTARLALQKMPPLDTLEPVYTLDLYKIQYKTPAPNGMTARASGLVAMPALPMNKVSIVSFHHGTRVARSDAPSSNKATNYIYPAVFASSGGYMLVMPDYLGLGDSDLPLHPYVHSETLASSSIDMLIAAKELAAVLHYPINDKLFLAGYSEGGFTTMVTYEALLKNHKELPVTAAAPGSAPYDWNETLRFITQQPGPRASLYLAYFFYSMQTYFHYWNGLDVIFKAPYNTLVPLLFDGLHEGSEILQALPSDPRHMLQEAFLDSMINGSDPNIKNLISNFNHYDFKSTSPLLLVGTKGDHNVPYHGAEIAYQQLKSKSDMVYIKHVSDVLDHVQAAPFVLKEQLEFFKRYEN
nr:alpha/beta hydrolase [Aquicella siphonis]